MRLGMKLRLLNIAWAVIGMVAVATMIIMICMEVYNG